MKLKNLKIIALIAVGLFLISACGNPAKDSHSGMHSNTESEAGHMQAGETDEQNHSNTMGSHMDHMNDVRKWLQEELGGQYDIDVPASAAGEIEAGKTVYLKVCQSCHGVSGKGDGPASAGLNPKPADFTDADHSRFYSDKGRLHIIRKGVKGTAMVAWEDILSDIEINNVHAYIRSLRSDGSGSEHGNHNHNH